MSPHANPLALILPFSARSFVGGNQFCIKACDPTITDPNYCQNIFDLLGCTYNMPAAYEPGVFESCESDNQLPAGIYVVNGVSE
jgi:hypothetical protein